MGACSLNDIVAATSIDQATIRGVVERLASRNLLAISEDPNDKRKLSVSLSSDGQRFLERMISVAEGVTQQTFGKLNPAECVALVYLLDKMCNSPVGS